MSEKYLIINAGSSSLKFSLYVMPEQVEIINGLVEKIIIEFRTGKKPFFKVLCNDRYHLRFQNRFKWQGPRYL